MISFWLVLGVVLTLLELVLPGAVAVFLGFGALAVALALYLGLVEGWISAFTFWFISSLLLLIILRSFLQRICPKEWRKGSRPTKTSTPWRGDHGCRSDEPGPGRPDTFSRYHLARNLLRDNPAVGGKGQNHPPRELALGRRALPSVRHRMTQSERVAGGDEVRNAMVPSANRPGAQQ